MAERAARLRGRKAVLVAAAWTASGAGLLAAGLASAVWGRPEPSAGWLAAIAGLVMLFGSPALWDEARR